jgi:rhamnogalacturonan endolyase
MNRNLYSPPAGYSARLRRWLGPGTSKLAALGWLAMATLAAAPARSQSLPTRQPAETLGRGVVAVDQGNGQVFVSWRLLTSDAAGTGFDLYRQSAGGAAVKLNTTPIATSTNWVDATAGTATGTTYFVRAVRGGVAAAASAPAPVWPQQFMRLPLQQPAGGTTPTGEAYTYSPGDCSVGDLDGDGQQEIIVKWDPSNQKDNSQSGYTGNVYLDAYQLNGTRLWRIDLGKNIRAGAHYTQFMVFDLDGDGKAELACKTSDGTTDGTGQVLGNATADYRNTAGYILSGPEYLTVFNGQTGAAYPSAKYLPQRHPTVGDNPTPAQMNAIWGDNYGNRIDRFLACIAYLDGVHPSLVMTRGYYTRTVLVAWDFKDGQLSQRWTFDSNDGNADNLAYRGQGNHNLSVADVDGDGKDEIIYGSCAIDDNGKGLYATGRGHGDAMHLSDFDPTRPGLEIFSVHETQSQYGSAPNDFRDAATGTLIWGAPGPNQGDVGRGIAMDIDPRTLGAEAWSSRGGLYAANGTQISTAKPGPMNFGVWWDGDLLRENLDGTTISKWNWLTSTSSNLLSAGALGAGSNNGTKATPNLSVDLFGDWREEVIWRNTNNQELLIFTTTIPTTYRLPTLLQDPQYRLSIAWQNVGYNQPAHTGFYLGDGMKLPRTLTWTGASSTDWNTAANWSPAAVPTADDDVIIPGGTAQQPTVSAAQAVRNLTLGTSAVLTATSTSTLTVSGDFVTEGGTLTAAGDATVVLAGATDQVIGGGLLAFQNLTVGTATASLTGPVQVAKTLVLNGNLTTNDNLTLGSNAAGTALVVNNGAAVATGNVTVQRYLDPSVNPGLGYRHYASPVGTSTVGDLTTTGFSPEISQAAAYNNSPTPGSTTPFPTVFGYDQALVNRTTTYVGFDKGFFAPSALTTPLVPGRGYAVNIGSGELVDFVGSLNNGPVSVAVARNAAGTLDAADAGWQFLGNPYPAPLNYSLVDAADRNGFEAAIYVYSSTSQYQGQYRAYVNGVGNPVLPVAQGFFARVATPGTSATFTFRNSQRLTSPDATAFQRSAADSRPQVQLDLGAATGPADTFYAYAETGASSAFDATYDATKLLNPRGLNLASLAGGTKLAIDGRAAFTATTAIALAVGVPAAGSYSLSARAFHNLPTGLVPYLHDSQTGQTVLLTVGTRYAFSVTPAEAATTIAGRFTLQFSPLVTLATTPSLSITEVTVHPNPAHARFTVQVPPVAAAPSVQAELLNTLGQAVRRQSAALPVTGATLTVETTGLAPGVYVLRLQAGTNIVTKRVVVQ